MVKIQERVLSHEHLDIASTYNSIGEVYWHQAKYPEALNMYQKLLDINIKVHGCNHLDVATTKNKYADYVCLHFCLGSNVCVSVQHWYSLLCSRQV